MRWLLPFPKLADTPFRNVFNSLSCNSQFADDLPDLHPSPSDLHQLFFFHASLTVAAEHPYSGGLGVGKKQHAIISEVLSKQLLLLR